jgi:hypothetical protein
MATATKQTQTIKIGSTHYATEPAEAPPGFRTAHRLTRVDPRRGLVSHVVARSGAGDLTCSCEAFGYRRDRSEVCKHLDAAMSAGLL